MIKNKLYIEVEIWQYFMVLSEGGVFDSFESVD